MRNQHMKLFALLFVGAVACAGGEKDDTTDTDTDTDVTDVTDPVTDDTQVTDTDETDVEDTDAACWVDSDAGTCWDCGPPAVAGADSLKTLNGCTDASFARFDNGARIPADIWKPGDPLPALP